MSTPLPVVALNRQDALHVEIQGQSLGLMELDDLQNRIEVMLGDLAPLRSILSDLRRRYGPRTMAERLDDRELERVLNVMHLLIAPAQTFRVE